MRLRRAGFSLIELMIVVALIAIITTISVASYRQYTLRANRTDAGAALLRIAAAQEHWFLNNNQYSDDPAVELKIGATSEHGYYKLTINRNADPATGYRAVAEPVPGGRQGTDTDCQELSIDETGLRQSAPAGVDVCWR